CKMLSEEIKQKYRLFRRFSSTVKKCISSWAWKISFKSSKPIFTNEISSDRDRGPRVHWNGRCAVSFNKEKRGAHSLSRDARMHRRPYEQVLRTCRYSVVLVWTGLIRPRS